MERSSVFHHMGACLLFGAVMGCLLLAKVPRCSAQQSSAVSPEIIRGRLKYDRHLRELQTSIPEWRAAVEQIDLERLRISYQDGKIIDQEKGTTLRNLESAARFVTAIQRHNRLSDQISLFGLLGEINSSMVELSHDLLAFARVQDQQVVTEWTGRITTITGGSLTKEQIFQLEAVTAFADYIQTQCCLPAQNAP